MMRPLSLSLLSLFLYGSSTISEAFVTSRSANKLSFLGHALGPPRTFLNSGNGASEEQSVTDIDKEEMTEVLSQLEGDNNNNYVVIDVRGADEIMMGTGTMSEKVHILPLPQITAAFDLDEKSFEAQFNFPKPSAEDDTLVFTCKMGGRSQQAAQIAAMSGYKNIINYTGGADDWFGGEFVYT